MFAFIYELILEADSLFWGYLGFSMIVFLGGYLTLKTRFFQLRAFPKILKTFGQELFNPGDSSRGLQPIKVFFASVGGMLGVGNVVGIVTAIQLGGPGALLWVWVACFVGTLIKYAEIYLGLSFRVKNDQNSYDGGPMYFLQKAFGVKWISIAVSLLLCVYGAEIYQFNVVVDTLSFSWGIPRLLATIGLLSLVIFATIGGVPRVAKLCSMVMPVFMIVYISLCVWVIGHYFMDLPGIIGMVFTSAFTGHAAVGGFAGSTVMLAIQNGMAGACYSADIGIGYDSTIQSESHTAKPERQARMAIVGVCLDNFICTLSILVVLVTGLWQIPAGSSGAPLVQLALEQHFPFISTLMPMFIFILGYTTLIAYLIVGTKCARFIYPKNGGKIYLGYAIAAFSFFAFFDQTVPLLVMRLAGAMLLLMNLGGIFMLRHHIRFDGVAPLKDKEQIIA